MAVAVLSCFHGPQVESSFSLMGEILDPKSSRMKIDTYSAIQTVKYNMKAKETTAQTMFGRSDVLYDHVNEALWRNMMVPIGSTRKSKKEKEKS